MRFRTDIKRNKEYARIINALKVVTGHGPWPVFYPCNRPGGDDPQAGSTTYSSGALTLGSG
jgi:hypothetical protein